jgi:hypothetical protein
VDVTKEGRGLAAIEGGQKTAVHHDPLGLVVSRVLCVDGGLYDGLAFVRAPRCLLSYLSVASLQSHKHPPLVMSLTLFPDMILKSHRLVTRLKYLVLVSASFAQPEPYLVSRYVKSY